MIKLLKINDKEKIIKVNTGKKDIIYKEEKLRITADFLLETIQVRIWRSNIFKVPKKILLTWNSIFSETEHSEHSENSE